MPQVSVPHHPPSTPARPGRSGLAPTLALLVLTMLIGNLAVIASHRGSGQHLALSELTQDTVLMQSQIDAVPLGARWAGIMRATLASGAVWSWIQQGYEDVGAQLFRVERGTLTVLAPEPMQVVAAGASQPGTIAANTPTVLQSGDYGFTPAGVTAEWRNTGSEPLGVVYVELAVVGWDTHTVLPPGVTRTLVIEQRTTTEPQGPLLLTVRQVTLPFDALLGLALLSVVSGELQALDPPQTRTVTNPLLPPEVTGHRLSKGTAAMGTFRPGRVLSNPGSASTTLLLLTITPVGS